MPQFAESIQKGIRLHRQIDRYTDNHPVVRQGTHRLQPHHHKYAPVVIDVLYDHLLIQNWSRYSKEPLSQFTDRVYEILNRRMEAMPGKMQKRLPRMIAANWLMGYGTISGLEFVFARMQERARFEAAFEAAPRHLLQHYEAFFEEFNLFFPEVIEFVEGLIEGGV